MKKSLLLAISVGTILSAQNLQTTVQEVINTNPIIQERLKNYNYFKQDIKIAESGYYPTLDLSLGAGYESKPVGVAGLGVYDNALTYTQNIFNGFATTHQIAQQKHKSASAAYGYVESVNDTAFEMLNTYLQVMKNEELIKTAQENIDINEEIFTKVKKLYDSGLTTLSEVNKIESSLSLAKSNHIVQENTLLDVTYNMKRILGRFLDPKNMIKPKFNSVLPATLEEASQFAILHNPSLLISNYNIKFAQATFKEKKSPYYPSIDIKLTQSASNYTDGTNDSFRAMTYLNYNIFNGFSDNAALQQSRAKIHQEVASKNNLRRQVLEGLELSWAANEKLTHQMKFLKEYKNFALETLKLYSKEYDLGRRSLLDLLSAQNDFIASKSQLINNEYTVLYAKYRILDAMGTLVSEVLGDTGLIYSNIEENDAISTDTDELPIHLDSDNDLITDDKDICANSLTNDMKNIYGCKTVFPNVLQIEKYSGFIFSRDIELSDEGNDRLNNLILQIKEYGFEHLKFHILGNADQNMDKEALLVLSAQRAEVIKKMLLDAGAYEKNINIIAQSNLAPMYTNETSNANELNNRVDIIVKKLIK